MLRISGLDDARVTEWEAKLEQAVVDGLTQVMETVARRFERITVTAVALVAADENPPPQTGQLAIPPPEPRPAAIPDVPGPPAAPYISPDDLATIAPMWQQVAAEQVLPLVAQVFIDAAGRVRSQLLDHVPDTGVLSVPALGSPVAEEYLRQARNTYSQVGDHLWATARAQLSEGFEAGESIDEIAARMRRSAGLAARSSVLVARTSVIEASNYGSITMARASGLEMEKEWIATPDLRTRPTHLAADGQRVPIGQPFTVGGYAADFPAAPNLPPSERYRCRCTLGYVMPESALALPSPTIDRALPGAPAVTELPPEALAKEPGPPAVPGPGGDLDPIFGDHDARYVRPSLVRAGTPAQLQQTWQDELSAIAGRAITVDPLPASISPLTAREYAEATMQLMERYPEAKLARIAWDAQHTGPEYAWVYQHSQTITFAERWASDGMRRQYLTQLKSDVAKWDQGLIGWSVRGASTPQATVYHEFMHILDIETLGRTLDRKALQLVERRAALEGISADDLVARDISAYAGGDLSEMIAEAGTDVMLNGRNASLISREIMDLVDTEYRARGFGIRTGLAEPPDFGDVDFFPKAPGPRDRAAMTVAQLRAEAKARGIAVPAGTRKADLTKMLDEAQPPSAVPAVATEVKVMTRAQADRWAADSAIDIELQHGTTEAAAASIQRAGFDIERLGSKTDTGNFGAGFYFNPAGAPSYGEAAGYGATLFARARVERVMLTSSRDYARARAVEDYIDILHSQGAASARRFLDADVIPSTQTGRYVVDHGVTNADLIGDISDTQLARYLDLRSSGRPSGFVLREWAMDEGYGAVIVDFPGTVIPGFPVRNGATWFEVNVFDPSDIAIIKTPRVTARAARASTTVESAAVRRQAAIDTKRTVAEQLGDVDEMLVNGASGRALAARAKALRALAGEGDAGKAMAPVLDAMEAGDAAAVRDAILAARRGQQLEVLGGRAGEIGRFDARTMQVAGDAHLAAGAPVIITRPGATALIRGQRVEVSRATVVPATVDEVAAAERKALRAAARARAAEIGQARGNAALLADVDQLIARKATKAQIRQALDPALAAPEQLYAGADPVLMAALRDVLDSGDMAKLRAAVTRQTRIAKVTPIGKAGAKTTFDPSTMTGLGDVDIPIGSRVVVVRRGTTLDGLTDPLAKAQVRLDAPALRFDAKAAKTFDPNPAITRRAELVKVPPGQVSELVAPDGEIMRFTGSYMRVEEPGQPGKFYGSALDEWRAMYDEIPDQPGRWVKKTPVKAYQHTGEPRTVTTKLKGQTERTRVARDGDWIVRQAGGEVQVLDDAQFRRLYVEPKPPAPLAPKVVSTPDTPAGQAYAGRVRRLDRTIGRTQTASPRQLGGGSTSDVTLETYGQDRVVRKTYGRRSPHTKKSEVGREADAEILAPQVVEAFGVDSAATARTAVDEIVMEFVDGETFAETYGIQYWGDAAGMARVSAPFQEVAAGRRLGLADYVMGNTDRNEGNWIMRPDGSISAIDHGYAFAQQRGTDVPAGFFTEYLMRGAADPHNPYGLAAVIDFDPAELAQIRTRLEALAPVFEDAGRKSWHQAMMRRLREVEKRLPAPAPVAAPVKAVTREVKRPPKLTIEQQAAAEGVTKAQLSEIRRLMRTAERPPVMLSSTDLDYARLARSYADSEQVKAFAREHLAIYNRIAQDRMIADYWSQVVAPKFAIPEGLTRADLQRQAVERFAQAIDGKPVIIRRAREDRLRQALEDGRLKTQFETGTSSGVLDTEMRANFEEMTWGYPRDLPPVQRPVYGYISPDRTVGPASNDAGLTSAYGDIQVVLRDSVRPRITVSASDSLDRHRELRPAPLDAVDYRATLGHDIDYISDDYIEEHYVEAQIHGGVTWDDVAEVVFARQPEAATVAALEQRGVSWRVLS